MSLEHVMLQETDIMDNQDQGRMKILYAFPVECCILQFVPKEIHLPFPVEKMSCGGTVSLFQTRNGLLYVSGYIGMTEEEFNSSKDLYNTPFLYPFPSEQVTDISAGYDYALVCVPCCC